MKKINVKKLNAYLMSLNNSQEMKSFVQDAVYTFMNQNEDNVMTPVKLAILNDLGLLEEQK